MVNGIFGEAARRVLQWPILRPVCSLIEGLSQDFHYNARVRGNERLYRYGTFLSNLARPIEQGDSLITLDMSEGREPYKISPEEHLNRVSGMADRATWFLRGLKDKDGIQEAIEEVVSGDPFVTSSEVSQYIRENSESLVLHVPDRGKLIESLKKQISEGLFDEHQEEIFDEPNPTI